MLRSGRAVPPLCLPPSLPLPPRRPGRVPYNSRRSDPKSMGTWTHSWCFGPRCTPVPGSWENSPRRRPGLCTSFQRQLPRSRRGSIGSGPCLPFHWLLLGRGDSPCVPRRESPRAAPPPPLLPQQPVGAPRPPPHAQAPSPSSPQSCAPTASAHIAAFGSPPAEPSRRRYFNGHLGGFLSEAQRPRPRTRAVPLSLSQAPRQLR